MNSRSEIQPASMNSDKQLFTCNWVVGHPFCYADDYIIQDDSHIWNIILGQEWTELGTSSSWRLIMNIEASVPWIYLDVFTSRLGLRLKLLVYIFWQILLGHLFGWFPTQSVGLCLLRRGHVDFRFPNLSMVWTHFQPLLTSLTQAWIPNSSVCLFVFYLIDLKFFHSPLANVSVFTFSLFYSAMVAIRNYHNWVGPTAIIPHDSKGWRVWDQFASRFELWWGLTSWFADGILSACCVHM